MQNRAGKGEFEDTFVIIKSLSLIFREVICYLKVLNKKKTCSNLYYRNIFIIIDWKGRCGSESNFKSIIITK